MKIRVSGCHSHVNASQVSELLLELTSSLCCHLMATGIVFINTRWFLRLFEYDNLLFYCCPTGSCVKITVDILTKTLVRIHVKMGLGCLMPSLALGH